MGKGYAFLAGMALSIFAGSLALSLFYEAIVAGLAFCVAMWFAIAMEDDE